MRATAPLDTPLWLFSLAVYGSDGVADECLALQEQLSLDVNLLLFAAFTGAVDGVHLAPRDIAAANSEVAGWHDEVVRTLRGARRALKPPSLDAANPLRDSDVALREQVKSAELSAEKIEQAMLWQWSRRELVNRKRLDRGQALSMNVRGVLEFYGMGTDAVDTAAHRLCAAAAVHSQA
jgi:uncharacterized protein (TIGR02444 family)